MKRRLLSLFKTPRVTRKDVWITAFFALLWIGSTYLRPRFIDTHCAKDPTTCRSESVTGLDHYSLGKDSGTAEDLSTYSQIFTGTWAYLVPLSLHMTRAIALSNPLSGAFLLAGEDALLITETLVVNGSANEIVRLFAQRPRPYVYKDPTFFGVNPANYTSFYSGHTSFSSTMNAALFFVMLGRCAPIWLMFLTGVGGQTVVVFTGITRILAGRHFFTDVVWGAIAGFSIALMLAMGHRSEIEIDRSENTSPKSPHS